MPKYEITGPDGKRYEVNAPDGATEQDAISYVKGQYYPDEPAEQVGMPNEELQRINENMGALESLAVATGRGMHDIARGVGLVDEESEAVKRGFEDLERRRPISQAVGRAAGQSAPFLLPGTAAGAIGNLGARAGAMAGLGVLEGGLIADATGATDTETAKAAGIGGTIAGSLELVNPILGRVVGGVLKRLNADKFTDNLITSSGEPTKRLKKAMADSGVDFSDVQEFIKANPENAEQAVRKAVFDSQGIPITKGELQKDFAQLATENRLLESAVDPMADQFRNFKLEQSNAIENAVNRIIPEGSNFENVGDSVKAALSKREGLLRRKKNRFYELAGRQAENIGGIPIMTESIFDALPDERTLSRIARNTNNQSAVQAVEDLLTEFGVADFESSIARGIEPLQLDVSNFEDFRQGLQAIQRADQTGGMSVITGPLIRALDFEVDNLAENALKNKGASKEVSDVVETLKRARETTRELKQRFSPQSITGKLIASQRDGSTPVIEASQVLKRIATPNTPVEFLERTVREIKKAGGSEAKLAMGDLQSATVMNLMDEAFKAKSRQIRGNPVFNPNAFAKKIDSIGDEKLKLIFSDNPAGYRQLKKMQKIAQELTVNAATMPKGSAMSITDILQKMGLYSISTKIPGFNYLVEGLTNLQESQKNRLMAQGALNARPERFRKAQTLIEIAPNLAKYETAFRGLGPALLIPASVASGNEEE